MIPASPSQIEVDPCAYLFDSIRCPKPAPPPTSLANGGNDAGLTAAEMSLAVRIIAHPSRVPGSQRG